jgi:hypothetical protein
VEGYCRAGQATDDNIIERRRVALWLSKTTNTYSEYVILIAFPLHQSLHEHASVIRYTHTHGLSC